MEKIVKEFVLPWPVLVLFGAIASLLITGEIGIAEWTKEGTVIARDAQCTLKSIEPKKKKFVAILDCSGSEESTEDLGFLTAMIKTPKTLSCTRYYGDQPTCELTRVVKTN